MALQVMQPIKVMNNGMLEMEPPYVQILTLGYRIDTAYPKKVDIRCKPMGKKILKILHGLNNAPSAVSLYVIHTIDDNESLEKIEADIEVTNVDITITFIELPPGGNDLELLVRSLI